MLNPTPWLKTAKPTALKIYLAALLFSVIQPQPVFALSSAQIKQIAWHPVWLKLLHADQSSGRSQILTDDFFLAGHAGRHDPQAELAATIAAYAVPWQDNSGSHARCRFPARYYWLSQQIPLPDYTLVPPQCTTLARWSLPNKVKSVSLFLVSGYLGNPASVFGHSLLKLNTGAQDDQAGLFDLTVNYGALVPQDEPVWRYILRGLGGGYQAGFSDRYFYTQDVVYSRTEFRDIWDYELLLTDRQRTLLVLHLWEVLGKKFTYYFLDQNCAYRLAELLELVMDEPLLEQAAFWYAPVETFHRLEEIDQTRKAAGQPGLIRSVRFIPSAQRSLYHQFSLLRAEERNAVQTVIEQGPHSLLEQLRQIDKRRQAEALDTLLAYCNYRLTAEQPAPSPETLAGKKQILPARFLLPPATEPYMEMPALKSPATGDRPMLTSLGFGHDGPHGAHLRLHWSPFSQEAVGRNSLEGDELVLLDTALGFGGEQQDVFISNVDLIRIRKIKTDTAAVGKENPWSWQLRTSIESEESGDLSALFAFGVGRAWKLGGLLTTYAMAEASAHSLSPYSRLHPYLGILSGKGRLRGHLHAGVETAGSSYDVEPLYGADLQCSLLPQMSLFVGLEQRDDTEVAVELKWHW